MILTGNFETFSVTMLTGKTGCGSVLTGNFGTFSVTTLTGKTGGGSGGDGGTGNGYGSI